MIFGHPSAYATLSERDVITLAGAQPRFGARGCRILGVTQSDPVTERAWIDSLSERHGMDIAFPILSDEDGRIAAAFGMSTRGSDDGREVATTIILDPELRVRAVLEHPQSVGRGPEEVLRIVDALAAATFD
ncbi:Alkyl hydroperoxide reductase subunit C [Rhodobacteraceae bacterium THAF1]|nr:Alkyl hydroperoxide reductase subunit C [Palleronia sp. THAF1]VDC17119.1 Alkyl hydroperoxide reductase subunit C [Rhodobacteraceae bacterium THAF1]